MVPGRRSGAPGAMLAISRASAQPITASSHRSKPRAGSRIRVVTTIDCTAAWMIINCPAPTSVASAIEIATTTITCQVPVPNPRTKRSPTAMPTATPIATSTPRRSRWP